MREGGMRVRASACSSLHWEWKESESPTPRSLPRLPTKSDDAGSSTAGCPNQEGF
nr:unnamed protein product [Digitaria exilis]